MNPVNSIPIKQSIADLGVLGGDPLFEKTLHIGGPSVRNREQFMKRVERILDSHWLTNDGPEVRELEKRIAEHLGVRHCVAMCNGTVALEIAIRALELKGEVIIPSFTFIATAHALQWQEITPVFCDVDPATHNIDPRKVEDLITDRTSGVLGVHVWGNPCDVEGLEEVTSKHGLRLMFDASHAFSCSHRGRMIGGFGEAEVFSFHATKFMNTFEGGAVTTDNDALAQKLRLMRNFGFAGMDNVIYIGTNGKMNEIAAAMGLSTLDALDEIIEINKANFEQYQEGLIGSDSLSMLTPGKGERHNFQYIILTVEPGSLLSRDALIQLLHAEGVRARRYFYPGCHNMEPYRTKYPDQAERLKETNTIAQHVLCMPTGPRVSPRDIEKICEFLHFAQRHADSIKNHLQNENAAP